MAQATSRRARLVLGTTRVLWLGVPLALGLLWTTGCPSDREDDAAEGAAAIQRAPVDPKTVGTVEGVVRFSGEVPERVKIKMARVTACATRHSAPAYYDRLLATDGFLANAFVTIKTGLERFDFPAAEGAVEIDQQGCVYVPRVTAARVGQDVTFINSDATNHNVHAVGKANRSLNFSMPSKDMRATRTFKKPEVMVRLKCDVHPWMGGYIGVQRHPHMAVTGPDGSFRFEGVPPGSYTVLAWHETLGTQELDIQLQKGGLERAEFRFNPK